MSRIRAVLFMVIVAMMTTSIGASASSTLSRTINPEIMSPATTIGTYDQANGVCADSYQQAKGWMDAYRGSGVNYIQIKQRFQWWNGYRWITQQTWTTYRYISGYGSLSNSHKFYYRGYTVTHTTRIQSEFSWWRNNTYYDVKRRSSGYCYP